MLLILDWDGTIIDSAAKIVGCMQRAALETGLEPRDEQGIRNIIGLGLGEAIRCLYPEIADATVEQVRESYSRNFVAADQTPCEYFPGVIDTLEALRADGVLLAVATGKSRRGLNRVLGNLGLEDFFHASRCADETCSKPDPLMLRELCEELARPASEAVMVGDTEYDMEMAARFDMPRIGVSYGAHSAERLHKWQPLDVVDEFARIRDHLSR